MKVKSLSRVRLLATPWTAAYQAPSSMGFSRQEYWSGVPLPSPFFFFHLTSYLMLHSFYFLTTKKKIKVEKDVVKKTLLEIVILQ